MYLHTHMHSYIWYLLKCHTGCGPASPTKSPRIQQLFSPRGWMSHWNPEDGGANASKLRARVSSKEQTLPSPTSGEVWEGVVQIKGVIFPPQKKKKSGLKVCIFSLQIKKKNRSQVHPYSASWVLVNSRYSQVCNQE